MALGSSKLSYVYTDDTGKTYSITLASDDVLSNSGLTVYDPANPPTNYAGKLAPWRCRRVNAQGTSNNKTIRRRLVCGTVNAGLYASNLKQTVTISGVSMTTTGRRGEKITF